MSSIWKRIINDFHINSFEEIAYFNVDIGVWRVSVSHRHKTVGSCYSIKITIWNFGNFTDPTRATSRLVIDLESRIQKSDTGDNSFVKWKGTVWSDRPVKVDHLQSWSRKFWSDQTEMVRSIWCTNRKVRNFGFCMVLCWVAVWRLDCFVKQPLVLLAITMWREKVGQNPCPENRPIVQFDTTPTQSQA